MYLCAKIHMWFFSLYIYISPLCLYGNGWDVWRERTRKKAEKKLKHCILHGASHAYQLTKNVMHLLLPLGCAQISFWWPCVSWKALSPSPPLPSHQQHPPPLLNVCIAIFDFDLFSPCFLLLSPSSLLIRWKSKFSLLIFLHKQICSLFIWAYIRKFSYFFFSPFTLRPATLSFNRKCPDRWLHEIG